MASATIGALRVILSADTVAFAAGLKKADRDADAFSKKLTAAFSRIGAAIVAVAGPLAVGRFVSASMQAIDAQAKLADRVGASVVAIQTLEHAASLAGVSQEQLAKALELLNARLGEAARTGAGPAAEALERLGLSAQELASMDADERIAALADRMKELGLTASQMGDTLRQMGIRSAEVINLLQEGAPAIAAARRDVEEFGIAVSDIDAAQVEAANDAWDRAKTSLTGLWNQLAVFVAPAIETVANLLTSAITQVQKLGTVAEAVAEGIAYGFAWIGDQVRKFQGAVMQSQIVLLRMVNWVTTLTGGTGVLGESIEGLTAEYEAFANAPMPTERFSALRREREQIDALNAGLEEARANYLRMNNLDDEGNPIAAPIDLELGGRIQSIRDSLRSEREVLTEAYETRHADLLAAREADLLTEEEYNTLQAQLLAEHNAKLAEIDAAGRASGGAADAEHRAQQLLALQESLMSEQELEIAAYEQKLADLDAFFAEGLLRQEDYNRLRLQLEEQHNEEMARLREEDVADQKRADYAKAQSALGVASAIAGGLNNLFKENKALAIANAVINTAEAVTKNLAAYPGPVGVGMAAAALLNGIAQIRAITSTNKGSKTQPPGLNGGGSISGFGAAGGEATGADVPSRTLFISGIDPRQLYSGDAMRGFMEEAQKYLDNGGKLVIR